jgi:hypothetical protein
MVEGDFNQRFAYLRHCFLSGWLALVSALLEKKSKRRKFIKLCREI